MKYRSEKMIWHTSLFIEDILVRSLAFILIFEPFLDSIVSLKKKINNAVAPVVCSSNNFPNNFSLKIVLNFCRVIKQWYKSKPPFRLENQIFCWSVFLKIWRKVSDIFTPYIWVYITRKYH